MPRTKQTARKSTGGRAPRRQAAGSICVATAWRPDTASVLDEMFKDSIIELLVEGFTELDAKKLIERRKQVSVKRFQV